MKRKRILVLGAVLGALMGMTAAYVVAQRLEEIEREGRRARLRARPKDWIKLLMAVVGVARQFSRLIAPD